MPDIISESPIKVDEDPTVITTVSVPEATTSIVLTPSRTQVRVTRRKTNSSDIILITVNADTKVVVNGVLLP